MSKYSSCTIHPGITVKIRDHPLILKIITDIIIAEYLTRIAVMWGKLCINIASTVLYGMLWELHGITECCHWL